MTPRRIPFVTSRSRSMRAVRACRAFVLCGLVVALLAFEASAQDLGDWILDGYTTLIGDQLELDAFVVFDDLASQLATPAGAHTVGFIREAAFLDVASELRASWSQIAASVGMDPDTALWRLLGDRVVVCVADLERPGAGGWAAATRVSTPDLKLIMRGLAPVHRDVIAGRAVFSIEDGAIDLAIVAGDQLDGQTERTRLLVIGSAPRREVFVALLRGLSGREGWAWSQSALPLEPGSRGVGAAPGTVLARLGLSNDRTVLAAGWAESNLWRGFVAAPSSRDESDEQPTWSVRAADAAIEGAALGLVGSVSAAEIEAVPLAPFLGITPARVRSLLGDGVRRSVLRIDRLDSGSTLVGFAYESPNSVAEPGDAAMAGLIGVLTGDSSRSPRFEGRVPSAVRCAPIEGTLSTGLSRRLIAGETSELAWGYADNQRWMAMVFGSGSDAVGGVRSLLDSSPDAVPGELLSAGRAEPGRLGEILERAAGLDRPVLAGANRIGSVRWWTRSAGPKTVKASFEIEMREGD